jgi:hypothetical protein
VEGGGIELVDYLAVNRTRERILSQQAQARERVQRARERATGASAGEPEDADHDAGHTGRCAEGYALRYAALPSPLPSPFPEPEEEDVNVGSGDQDRVVEDRPVKIARVTTTTDPEPSTTVDHDPSSLGRERGRGRRGHGDTAAARPSMPRWEDEAWAPVRDSWTARNLEYPPSAPQRRRLWPIRVEFPDLVGEWVAEAVVEDDRVESISYGIVRHVLAMAAAERVRSALPALFAELSDDEQTRWLAAEQSWPGDFINPMSKARETGEGLPDAAPGENPFRLGLPRMLTSLERLQDAIAATRRAFAGTEDANDGWTNV